jgi:hypothetical protein
MSNKATATLERKMVHTTSAFSRVEAFKNDNGGGTLKGLRIFKAGTFKDSMGFESTWETTHLEQMAFHFVLLRDNGYFPNVPLRVDHSYSANSVVGYLTAVYRDVEDDQFLACDVEITEPDAYEKWERGTFRSRSLEVGMYETNEGASYYPVVMGLAFVDIPAVEGLYGRKDTEHRFSQVITDTQEDEVPETQDHAGRNSNAGEPQTQTPIPAAATAPAAPPAAGAPPVASPPTGERSTENGGYSDHGAARPAAVSFRIDGRDTSDHAAVQRHIETLETFRTEAIKAGRSSFVTSLSENGQIMATQVDSMTALVQTMTEAQFNAFKDTYKDVPKSGLFEKHGQHDPGESQTNPVNEQIQVLEDTVQNLYRSGMKPESVEKTDSFKRLAALKAARATA